MKEEEKKEKGRSEALNRGATDVSEPVSPRCPRPLSAPLPAKPGSAGAGLTWTARDDGRRSNVFTAFTRQTSASQAYNNAPRNAAPSRGAPGHPDSRKP